MNTQHQTSEISLIPADNRRLANLCGQFDENLQQVEHKLGVKISSRGNVFTISGTSDSINIASHVLNTLYHATQNQENITPTIVHLVLQELNVRETANKETAVFDDLQIHTKVGAIKARSHHQHEFFKNIHQYDINFAVGPAGTGKTYLAMAAAVDALNKEHVMRIVLVRPAVEAGESLGFLPGDMAQKVDPYLRPLYDALYEMFGPEHVVKLLERNIIEIAPLAYMRGRTLNDAFVILDESQNATKEQMKMFLTRIGFGSKAIITGDITQVDLPKGIESGLAHAIKVLSDVKGLCFNYFDTTDVVRHPLVQAIVRAYDEYTPKS